MTAQPMTGLAALAELAAQRPLTIDDLPPEDDHGRTELIDGSLFVTPFGDLEHQKLISSIAWRLGAQCPPEFDVLPGVNVVRGDGTVIGPDVAVVDLRASVRNGLGIGPDGLILAVEVTSPSTRRRDLTIKRDLYAEWEVPYLLIDRKDGRVSRSVFGLLPGWVASALNVGS